MASNELAAFPTPDDLPGSAPDAFPASGDGQAHGRSQGEANVHRLSAPTRRIQLWDLPLRIFHWSLLAAITTAIVTGKLGGEWMPLHGKAGIAIVGLLTFRLVWGLVGSSTSRFLHFLPSPATLLRYLQGRWKGLGHNPLGALSVVALLGVIGVQVGSGLFSNDDIAFAGPLAALVGEETVQWLTGWHRLLPNALFVLLGLHVAAIVFHVKVKKDDIVKPMVTGWKNVPADQPPPRRARRIALVLAVAAGLGGAYGASGWWIKPAEPAPAAVAPSSSSGTQAPAAPAW